MSDGFGSLVRYVKKVEKKNRKRKNKKKRTFDDHCSYEPCGMMIIQMIFDMVVWSNCFPLFFLENPVVRFASGFNM